MATIRLKFGECVAGTKWTRTLPHLGGQTQEGEGRAALALPIIHPMIQPQNSWGPRFEHYLGRRATDHKVFFLWQIQTATAHAHNTATHHAQHRYCACCILYSTWSIEPKLGTLDHWHTTNIYHIPYFWSQMCMRSLNLLHVQFCFNLSCDKCPP